MRELQIFEEVFDVILGHLGTGAAALQTTWETSGVILSLLEFHN